MKRFLSIFIALALLTLTMGVSLAASYTTQADATSSATHSPSNGNSQNTAPGPRGNNGNFLMGSVTAISDTSITITTNAMQPPQNGNGPKDDDRQGGDRDHGPQGNKDQKNDNNPNGNAPAASESKSVTITINADTTVSTAGSQTALTVADITVGQQVSITVTGDETSGYTATAIEVLQNQPNASTAVVDDTVTEASETESSDT